MLLARMIVISLMVGIVAAGFVWLGSSLFENVIAVVRRARAEKASAAEAEPESPSEPPE